MEYCVVATIGGAYGVQGWAKLTVRSESVERFLSYDALYLSSSSRSRAPKGSKGSKAATKKAVIEKETWYPFQCEEIKPHGKGLIVKIPGCDTKEQVALFSGRNLAVPRDQLPQLDQDEHYWSDLIGLEVHSTEGDYYGRVDGLMETGANDVLIVQPEARSCDERERLIPYLPDQVIINVDSAAKRILVEWDKTF